MVSNKEVVSKVAERTGKTKKEVKELIKALLETITEFAEKEPVVLHRFGTFRFKERKPRRMVVRGKEIQAGGYKVLTFKASKDLRK